MMDKVKNTIKKFDMLRKGDAVIVAVSGGVDSVVLLHLLTELAQEYKLSLVAAHLNHCLRGKESDRDAAFVKKLAKKMKAAFAGKKVDIKLLLKKGESLQDAARKARYAFLEETARIYKAQRIATAHNLDDQAETVIMRFLKGAGIRGLSGIRPVRDKYIRPLMDVSRDEIEEYAAAHELKWTEDSSNKSAKYFRNRIRLKLLPVLEKYNPSLKRDMAKLAKILSRDEDYLQTEARDVYKKCVEGEQRVKGQGARVRKKTAISFSAGKIISLHDAIKARIFFMAVEELLGSSEGFYSYHVDDFLELLSNKAPNMSISLPRGLMLYKEYDVVVMEKGQGSRVKDREIVFDAALKINGKTKVIADCGLRIAEFKTQILNKSEIQNPKSEIGKVAYFDYNKVAGKVGAGLKPAPTTLIVRNFRPGDRIVPFGMNGHKKIKDLFIEKKIPFRMRSKIPLVVSGNEIIWVAGVRQGACCKVEPETKKILRIEIVKTGDNNRQ